MAKRGRPSTYDQEVARKICELLSLGLSLRAVCAEPQMPPESTVRLWVLDDVDGFAARYTRAREVGLDCLADRVIELAETPVIGEKRVQKANGDLEITTGDTVDRSRLAVDTLKWYLCKLAPKRYGEKVQTELSAPGGGSLAVSVQFVEPHTPNASVPAKTGHSDSSTKST